MNEKERQIAGLSTARDYANGVSGYDKENLDGAESFRGFPYDAGSFNDEAVRELIAYQLELDAQAEMNGVSEVRTEHFARRIAGPALHELAA